MTKDVLVSISGIQIVDPNDELQPIEIVAPGEYYFRNGKHYIFYEEVTEGFEGVTKSRIKIQPQGLDIMKRGIINAHMVFEKGREYMTSYETPCGILYMGIISEDIQLEEEENSIGVSVDYLLSMDDAPEADCHIDISIQSKGSAVIN